MPKVKLELGATLETLGPDEMRSIFSEQREIEEARQQAKAVGLVWRKFRLTGIVTNLAIVLGAGNDAIGPRADMMWQVRRVTVTGLSAAGGDTIGLYVNEITQQNHPEWYFTASANGWPQQTFGKGQITLVGGDRLMFGSIGLLGTTGQIGVRGEIVELPTVMQGKLL